MAMPSAPMTPPHIPMQWPPPSKPRVKADTSNGSSSGIRLLRLVFGDFFVGKGFGVVEPDAVGRAVQIVKLAAVYGPEENTYGNGDQDQCGGDHHIQCSHGVDSSGNGLRQSGQTH